MDIDLTPSLKILIGLETLIELCEPSEEVHKNIISICC
jgi:hypothetical protein